jgi:hypothetical protein
MLTNRMINSAVHGFERARRDCLRKMSIGRLRNEVIQKEFAPVYFSLRQTPYRGVFAPRENDFGGLVAGCTVASVTELTGWKLAAQSREGEKLGTFERNLDKVFMFVGHLLGSAEREAVKDYLQSPAKNVLNGIVYSALSLFAGITYPVLGTPLTLWTLWYLAASRKCRKPEYAAQLEKIRGIVTSRASLKYEIGYVKTRFTAASEQP